MRADASLVFAAALRSWRSNPARVWRPALRLVGRSVGRSVPGATYAGSNRRRCSSDVARSTHVQAIAVAPSRTARSAVSVAHAAVNSG